MAPRTVTDQLDAYLVASGAATHTVGHGKRGHTPAPERRRAPTHMSGSIVAAAQRQQIDDQAPVGVAGPHQKCFLEGPPQFPPPSPRCVRLRGYADANATSRAQSHVVEQTLSQVKVVRHCRRVYDPLSMRARSPHRHIAAAPRHGEHTPRSAAALPQPQRRAPVEVMADLDLPPQPLALSWRLGGLSSQRPSRDTDAAEPAVGRLPGMHSAPQSASDRADDGTVRNGAVQPLDLPPLPRMRRQWQSRSGDAALGSRQPAVGDATGSFTLPVDAVAPEGSDATSPAPHRSGDAAQPSHSASRGDEQGGSGHEARLPLQPQPPSSAAAAPPQRQSRLVRSPSDGDRPASGVHSPGALTHSPTAGQNHM